MCWAFCYGLLTDHKACEAGSTFPLQRSGKLRLGEGNTHVAHCCPPYSKVDPRAPDEHGKGEKASRVRSTHCQEEDGGCQG